MVGLLTQLHSQLNTGYLPQDHNYGGHDIWPFLGMIAIVVIAGWLAASAFRK